MSHFDYESAERDIRDAGGDPDYLSHYNEGSRDCYLGKMGLNPDDYGDNRESSSGGWAEDSSWEDDEDYTWSSSSMSLSEWRQSLKEDRQARAAEKYMKKSPDDIERDFLIIRALALLCVVLLLFLVVCLIVDGSDMPYSVQDKLIKAAIVVLFFAYIFAVFWPKIKETIIILREARESRKKGKH